MICAIRATLKGEGETMDSGLDGAGCVGGIVLVLVLAIVVAGLVLVPGAIEGMDQAAAERTQARANEIHAQADLEYTRSTAWQERFILWTSYLEHETGGTGGVVLGGVGGAVAAAIVVFAMNRMWRE
jgi:predicted PurR-regulated permease PerM